MTVGDVPPKRARPMTLPSQQRNAIVLVIAVGTIAIVTSVWASVQGLQLFQY